MNTLRQHKDCFQCLAVSDEKTFFKKETEHICVLGYRVIIKDRKVLGSVLSRYSKPLEPCPKPLWIPEFTK